MIGVWFIGLLAPLLSAATYRRTGLRWRSALGLAALALVLSLIGAVLFGFVYAFAITTSATLCGSLPTVSAIAAVAVYLVVASWAALLPRRVWAWPLAVGAALAVTFLVSYFFAGAHAYCET